MAWNIVTFAALWIINSSTYTHAFTDPIKTFCNHCNRSRNQQALRWKNIHICDGLCEAMLLLCLWDDKTWVSPVWMTAGSSDAKKFVMPQHVAGFYHGRFSFLSFTPEISRMAIKNCIYFNFITAPMSLAGKFNASLCKGPYLLLKESSPSFENWEGYVFMHNANSDDMLHSVELHCQIPFHCQTHSFK